MKTIQTSSCWHNNNADNDIAYASARDIGNYGTGYIAGRVAWTGKQHEWALMLWKVLKIEEYLQKA